MKERIIELVMICTDEKLLKQIFTLLYIKCAGSASTAE